MRIKRFVRLSAALVLSTSSLLTLAMPIAQASAVGAGTQATTITKDALTEISSASTISDVQTAMQNFVDQYNLTFDSNNTYCVSPANYTCLSLTNTHIVEAKQLSTEFIQEWSKYPVAWVAYTDLETINFVKDFTTTAGLNQARAAAPDVLDKTMIYDVKYAGSESYMRSVIHHEFDHYVEYTHYSGGSQADAVWSNLNPSGFVYGSGGASCYSGTCPSGEHAVIGFATGYSTSAIEEDKAELYAHLFWTEGSTSVQGWTQTDTVLAQKVANYKAFILSVVPSMNDAYFSAIHGYFNENFAPNSELPQDHATTTTTLSDDQPATNVTVASNETVILDGKRQDVTILNGGVLKGNGQAVTILVNQGGIIAPGHSPGCLNSGNLTLNGTYQAEVGGTTPCTGYDQLKVTGTVNVTNGTLQSTLYNGFVPKVGQSYTIIDNDGSDAVTGTFAGIAEGGEYTNQGVTYTVTYKGGDGNDVVLTVKSIDASKLPKAPDTGMQLIAAHPMLSLGFATVAAAFMVFVARRMQPAPARARSRR